MERINPFKGAGVALVTPFLPNGAVDYATLEQLLNQQLSSRTDFICLLGTTAETPCLSIEEKRHIICLAKQIVNGKKPLLLGCGSNNTQQIIQFITQENLDGVDGLLIVTPYYNKPRQEGLFQHYSAIAQNTTLPIVLYNVPGRTGVNLEAETVLSLVVKHQNIVAIKEASGNKEQIATLISQRKDGFDILCGDDSLALHMITSGASGVISVIGNAFPNEFSDLVHYALQGKTVEAQSIHTKYTELYKLLMKDGNPAGIKAVMSAKGWLQNNLRLPLVPASKDTTEEILTFLQNI